MDGHFAYKILEPWTSRYPRAKAIPVAKVPKIKFLKFGYYITKIIGAQ